MKEYIFKGLSIVEFSDKFRCEDDCVQYMANLKWAKGFVCRKCGHTSHGKGYTPFARKCSQCRYDERVTAGTMLEKCKTGLLKDFQGLYQIVVEKKGISSVALSEQLGINQKSAWLLRCKAQHAMKSSGNHPLAGKEGNFLYHA